MGSTILDYLIALKRKRRGNISFVLSIIVANLRLTYPNIELRQRNNHATKSPGPILGVAETIAEVSPEQEVVVKFGSPVGSYNVISLRQLTATR